MWDISLENTIIFILWNLQIFEEWERISNAVPGGPIVPPDNWQAPPPAGYVEARGMRRAEREPWRPVRSECPSPRGVDPYIVAY